MQTINQRNTLHSIPHECADRMLAEPKDEDDGYNSGRALCSAVGWTCVGVLLAWLVVALI